MTANGIARRPTAEGLRKYDPQKGLMELAGFEAAEKHFARAKDPTNLQRAIRGKLQAQADFVHWWDHSAEKDKGAAQQRRSRSATALRAGQDGIPERYVIDRWRQKLSDEERFELTYMQAVARYTQILEFDATAHVAQNSGENEWYTPAEIIEAARAVLGTIDLDPASTAAANDIVKASAFFTLHDDALKQPWAGRVWLNPPYAQPLITQFATKLSDSVRDGSVPAAVVLVNNATETEWFGILANVSSAICFPTGRIRFWNPTKETATPLQGQAVLYTGPHLSAFCAQFLAFGFVARILRT